MFIDWRLKKSTDIIEYDTIRDLNKLGKMNYSLISLDLLPL